MAGYKKQHFVPFVYLKEFSESRDAERAESYIWRAGGPFCGRVSTQKECFQNYFNSRTDPEGAEKIFQQYEQAYGAFAQVIHDEREPQNAGQYFAPIFLMINLHARNPAYDNQTGQERVEVYKQLEVELLHMLVPDVKIEPGLAEAIARLSASWRIAMLVTQARHFLITSDNPAHFYGDNSGTTLITLPVNPGVTAIAFRRDRWNVRGKLLSEGDWLRLNSAQARFCYSRVFSNTAPTDEEAESFQTAIANREKPPGFVNEDDWRPNQIRIVKPFEFLQSVTSES